MNYGLDVEQLSKHVVEPVCERISFPLPSLVLGTALHESHAKYLKQLSGPALGLWQMEPATHYDIHRNFLAYQSKMRGLVLRFAVHSGPPNEFPSPTELVGNLYYAAAMCAVHYLRASMRPEPKRAPLPANEPLALATYWKTHYNTILGKGTVDQALPHFEVACR